MQYIHRIKTLNQYSISLNANFMGPVIIPGLSATQVILCADVKKQSVKLYIQTLKLRSMTPVSEVQWIVTPMGLIDVSLDCSRHNDSQL